MLDKYDGFEGLSIEKKDEGILRIAMRAGDVGKTHAELPRLFLEAERDSDVRAILFGKNLAETDSDTMAGYGDATIRQMRAVVEDYSVRMRVYKEASDLIYNIINCTKPIVALYPGAFVPALVLADVSIAAPDSIICDAHVAYGAAAGDNGTMWPLHIGMAKAKYYLLTGAELSGAEAERIGLISLVAPESELEERGMEIARKLANGSQRAMRWTKQVLNNFYRTAGPTFDASVAMEFMCFGGDDVQEGIRSLIANRPPNFPERITS
ncbi:enoyl-CoA hydratase (plasmid) [Sphingomonas paeninsulae]|uniref:Enoyl-CoA hydratase n=1 Tax=Sphingomonas paeninsulae TaxID=2319844 RepID=A0A494T7P3_SPHPE|nr:enoyl-CoA hydratase-related protein [Sphingomonas paeninsulae]AYJ84910.1 enoyl-CoA hydratase [Sphingomonas paeninsulae]